MRPTLCQRDNLGCRDRPRLRCLLRVPTPAHRLGFHFSRACLRVATLSIGIATCLAGSAVATELQLQLADGSALAGELVRWNADSLELTVTGVAQQVPWSSLATVAVASNKPPDPFPGSIEVATRDGARLWATEWTMTAGVAHCRLADGSVIDLERKHLSWVRFVAPTPGSTERWQQVVGAVPVADQVVVERGGKLETVEGVLGDVTTEQAEFTLDGQQVPVRRGRIAALVLFQPQGPQLAAPVAVWQDIDRCQIPVSSWAAGEGDTVHLVSPAGWQISRTWRRLTSLRFGTTEPIWLDQLAPVQIRFNTLLSSPEVQPLLASWLAWCPGQSPWGGPLSDGGQVFERGVSLHSRTELVIEVPAGARRLLAIAGVDHQSPASARLRLEARADQRLICDQTLQQGHPFQELNWELGTASRLTLVVDFADDGEAGDRLVLANARFTP